MAKKSLFEKLGLVEGVAASEYDMPDTTNELRVCSGVGDHYINGDFPEDEPVQVEVPEGDTIDVRAVYETNGMNPKRISLARQRSRATRSASTRSKM